MITEMTTAVQENAEFALWEYSLSWVELISFRQNVLTNTRLLEWLKYDVYFKLLMQSPT